MAPSLDDLRLGYQRKIFENSFKYKAFKLSQKELELLFRDNYPRVTALAIQGKRFKVLGEASRGYYYLVTALDEKEEKQYKITRKKLEHNGTEIKPFSLSQLKEGDTPYTLLLAKGKDQLIDGLCQRVKQIASGTDKRYAKIKEIRLVFSFGADKDFIYKYITSILGPGYSVQIQSLYEFVKACGQFYSKSSSKYGEVIFFADCLAGIFKNNMQSSEVERFLLETNTIAFFCESAVVPYMDLKLQEGWLKDQLSVFYLSSLDVEMDEIDIATDPQHTTPRIPFPPTLMIAKERKLLLNTLTEKAKEINDRDHLLIVCHSQTDIVEMSVLFGEVLADFSLMDAFFDRYTTTKNLKRIADPEKLAQQKRIVFFYDCVGMFHDNPHSVEWVKDLFSNPEECCPVLWEFNFNKKTWKRVKSQGFGDTFRILSLEEELQKKLEAAALPAPEAHPKEDEKKKKEDSAPTGPTAPAPPKKKAPRTRIVFTPPPELPAPPLYRPPIYINDQSFLVRLDRDNNAITAKRTRTAKNIKIYYGPIISGMFFIILFSVILSLTT